MQASQSPDDRLLAAPVATSHDRPWAGVSIDCYEWTAPGRIGSGVQGQDVIGMRLSGVVRLTQVRDGKTHSALIGPGNIGIHPKGMPSEWAWDGPGAIMLMRVPPALLQQAAETALRGALPKTELVNCFSARDPFVERVVALFLAEIERPPHPAQAYVSQALSGRARAAPGAPLQQPVHPAGASAAGPQHAQPAAGAGLHRRPSARGHRPADAGQCRQCQPLSFCAPVPAQHRQQRDRLPGAGAHAARAGTDPARTAAAGPGGGAGRVCGPELLHAAFQAGGRDDASQVCTGLRRAPGLSGAGQRTHAILAAFRLLLCI